MNTTFDFVVENSVLIEYKGTNDVVELPEGITSIGECAFYNCKTLRSIVIPKGVIEIGYCAFHNCTNLQNAVIPDTVTSIGQWAFLGCSSLSEITIPYDLKKVGGDAFSGTPWDDSLSDGLVYVGKVFYKYKGEMPENTRIELKKDTSGIADGAFEGYRNLISITIPETVRYIGRSAFSGCYGITEVNIPNVSAWCSILFCGDHSNPLEYAYIPRLDGKEVSDVIIPDGTTVISKQAFYGCSLLKSIIIPDSVTDIGEKAFYGCKGLFSVILGNRVTSIGDWAFSDCASLLTISIPDSVKTIGEYAFYKCAGLESVSIGNGVTDIERRTFYGCKKLKSAIIGNGVSNLGDEAFRACSVLSEISVPESVTSIGAFAFSDTAWFASQPKGLVYAGKVAYKFKGEPPESNQIILKNDTKGIAAYAFWNCRRLSSISIPKSVSCVGNWAFDGCFKLKKVIISDIASWCNISFGYAHSNPLYYAHKLYLNGKLVTDLIVPSGVTSISAYAFSKCWGLSSVTLPDSLISIGGHAFEYCKNLVSINIPNSVKSIGEDAFLDCTNMKEI